MADNVESLATDADDTSSFDEGRYLYCAVTVDDEPDTSGLEDVTGIEDSAVSLVTRGDVGVVVHPVDAPYDSDDLGRVRRWLLSHQQVVDDAGRAFGTPLPFRFDTIVAGDDHTVVEWLEANAEELEAALEWLAGRWEYRIDLRWDESSVEAEIRESDEELRELSARLDEASGGTGFLVEKQYQTRLRERLAERRDRVAAELVDRLEPHTVEIRRAGGSSERFSAADDDDRSLVVRLSVLAEADREEAIGEELEPYADRPAYDVRYTGPWPPYSHAPSIGDDDGGDSVAGDGDAADDGGDPVAGGGDAAADVATGGDDADEADPRGAER